MERPKFHLPEYSRSRRNLLLGATAGAAISALDGTTLIPALGQTEQLPTGPKYDNGQAKQPPMGFNTYYQEEFGGSVVDQYVVLDVANAMIANGMRDAGYNTIVIDDGWQEDSRDANQRLRPNSKYGNGMPWLKQELAKRGFWFGLYGDIGFNTCELKPGSHGFEQLDADTFADWGADFMKIDWCYAPGLDAAQVYATMRDAIGNAVARTGNPITYSICDWGEQNPWNWGPWTGNMWRTTQDAKNNWDSVLDILDKNSQHAVSADPGRWNDPDNIIIGNGAIKGNQARSHFALWAMMSAPLFAGCDIRNIDSETTKIFSHQELIGINADPLGNQAQQIITKNNVELYKKPLADGTIAVAVFNRDKDAITANFSWEDIGVQQKYGAVREIWHGDFVGNYADGMSVQVGGFDTNVYRLNFQSGAYVAPYTRMQAAKYRDHLRAA